MAQTAETTAEDISTNPAQYLREVFAEALASHVDGLCAEDIQIKENQDQLELLEFCQLTGSSRKDAIRYTTTTVRFGQSLKPDFVEAFGAAASEATGIACKIGNDRLIFLHTLNEVAEQLGSSEPLITCLNQAIINQQELRSEPSFNFEALCSYSDPKIEHYGL